MLWEAIPMNTRAALKSVHISTSTIPNGPIRALRNFPPAVIHELNNNTLLMEKLARLKYEAKMKRKRYWEGRRA
jgi:hypothetical protein